MPSSPSCAARPGSRTIHMNSARPSGPIDSPASVTHVTLRAAQLEELGGEHLAEHHAHRLARSVAEEVALEVHRQQRVGALLLGERLGA